MKKRSVWINQIDALWRKRRIVWLSGVRRVGKTCLCRQMSAGSYLNCDLPSVQRQLADPEFYFQQAGAGALLLDEVHRLADPSLVLKIAADAYPDLFILATGSSTLAATRKFRDALTGRKHALYLPPILWRECLGEVGIRDFDRRLLHGGFPEMLLADQPDPAFFEEWMDSFYARDVQELFGVRNRSGFLNLLKLLCMRSGGQLDISDLAKETGMSRPTVMAHLDAMEIAHAIHRLPPFHGGGHREIVRQPRVYAFDTGLIAHVRGWEQIRATDRGHLWENLVLDELRSIYPLGALHYWRDKSQREIDFVVQRAGGKVDAIEAKINPDAFTPRSLQAFRQHHPEGDNLLICPFVDTPYTLRTGGFELRVCSTPHLSVDSPGRR